jgi:ABC-type Zn uptake system ZnuABC Zn-binding protein ZnuA
LKLTALALLITALVASACGSSDNRPEDEGLRVVATTSQIAALAAEVGGDAVHVDTLLGPGVDAHDFQPAVSDVRRVGAADVVLRNGIGLDDFLDDVIEGSGTDAEVTTVTEGVTLVGGEDDGHGHDLKQADPHVWQDPINVKVMVARVAEALSRADPDNAALYQARARAYQGVLDATDAEIRALIESIPPEDRKVVTNHDAFGYFLRRYGLEFVGAVIPGASSQSEPSAKEIAELVDLIEREGVKAIFAETSIDPAVARQLAEDTGVAVVDDLYSDSLGEAGSGAETVDGMLLTNARRIAEALS